MIFLTGTLYSFHFLTLLAALTLFFFSSLPLSTHNYCSSFSLSLTLLFAGLLFTFLFCNITIYLILSFNTLSYTHNRSFLSLTHTYTLSTSLVFFHCCQSPINLFFYLIYTCSPLSLTHCKSLSTTCIFSCFSLSNPSLVFPTYNCPSLVTFYSSYLLLI